MQKRKTKIICSIGPSSADDETVRQLILAGMNVARCNFSHETHEVHQSRIERVRRISAELGIPVAILLDTKGPEIRTGMVENNGKVNINKDDNVHVTADNCLTTAAEGQTPAKISISWKDAPAKIETGHHILIADGLLDLEVIDVKNNVINCRALNAAVIGSRKNVNLIGVHAQLPIMSEQDIYDIAFGIELDVDFIAASFVSFPHEVTEIKNYIESFNSSIKVIAKIENKEGIDNIREIAKIADGIMVARGDLGVQLPTEQIPLAQKQIISVCRKIGKPVITATQMLDSMIINPRPTRAELTDVANAIMDGTDAIMLSGETASGAYPVESVKMMDKISCTIEQSQEFRARMKEYSSECFSWAHNPKENLGIIMSRSGVEIASSVKAKAIITSTLSGTTARILSVFRPDEPILAITPDLGTQRKMQLYWGVNSCLKPRDDDTESLIQNIMKIATETGIAGISDKIMLVAGLPLNSPNMVNTVRVLILGTVLARSSAGGFANPENTSAQGKIIHATSPKDAREKIMRYGGEILVCDVLTDDYIPIVRIVKGVICEGVSEVSEERLIKTNPNLVWLTLIRNAAKTLEAGSTVTLDANQLLVYEGSVLKSAKPKNNT
ncbi:MAG: pyruvate kinase [Treponema sp.]|jgi:pyruvate kinase|nr:pyruvate kinase [Treponema sp.]